MQAALPEPAVVLERPASIEISAHPELVGIVRLFVGALGAGLPDAADERVSDMQLAVSEACTNAIASYAGKPGGRVRVTWSRSETGVEVRVDDDGPGFDPGPLAAALPAGADGGLPESGLGIPLMNALMDEISFGPRHPGSGMPGTTVCLRLNL